MNHIDADPEETAEWQESLDALVAEQGRDRAREIMLTCSSAPRNCTSACRWCRPPTTSTPSRPRTSPSSPATKSSSAATAPGSAGTPRSRCTARSGPASASAATSPPTRRPRPCTRSASTTSSAARTTPAAATRSSIQGHASPGMYARAFLEGRLSEDAARRIPPGEVAGAARPPLLPAPAAHAGVLAVPDRVDGPRPDQRDLPGAVQPVPHQPRHQGRLRPAGLGVPRRRRDGRGREPRPAAVAANEDLDNLTFVINCNLQRLDGPVRGNGKIIQELESFFRGAGWNVIKVVWGREWDDLLAKRHRRRAASTS